MRELDALLNQWLSVHYPAADSNARSAFADMLEPEDDVLWNWLLGRSKPESPVLQQLVEQITSADDSGADTTP